MGRSILVSGKATELGKIIANIIQIECYDSSSDNFSCKKIVDPLESEKKRIDDNLRSVFG